MPASYQKSKPHPRYKPHRMRDAARMGQLVRIHCGMCNRTVHYLAEDLASTCDPNQPANDSPFPCAKCKTDEYLTVKLRMPALEDYGHLIVRRPGKVIKTQKWENVRLGDSVSTDPERRSG